MPLSVSNNASRRTGIEYVRNILLFARMVWRTNPWLFCLVLLLRLPRAVLPVATLWVSKLLLDAILQVIVRHHGNLYFVLRLLAIDAALAVADDFLGKASTLSESLLADQFAAKTSCLIMDRSVNLRLADMESPAFHDILDRARRHSSGRITLLTSSLSFFQDFAALALLSFGLLRFSPWLFAILICAALPTVFGESHLTFLEYSVMYRRTPQRRTLDYLRWLASNPLGAKEMRLFSLGPRLMDRYLREWTVLYSENKRLACSHFFFSLILNTIPTVGYYAGYVLILFSVLMENITIGSFMFYTRTFRRADNHVSRLVSTFGAIWDEAISLTSFFTLLEEQPAEPEISTTQSVRAPIRSIEFRDVSFTYPNSGRPALSNVSFTLHSGETVALVGPNGSGKSTIAKLLARFYDPTEGIILLDGTDIREYDASQLREQMSAIFQDHMRYELTVIDNIAFSDDAKAIDWGMVDSAARRSLADGFIGRFDNGYHQMLGRRFEGGVELSGGEWQKLAGARAFMRDARIWIMDEPTAAMDVKGERQWLQEFLSSTKDSMILLITHRFSMARMADKIIVLSQGRIVEAGSHPELLRENGSYARMFSLQAAGFR